MNYEKLYKESLEKAKAFAAKYVGDGLLISSEGSVAKEFNEIFQELCESEDERIRKAIIEFFELQDGNTTYSFVPKKDILAWLEKHGEQKPTDKAEPRFEVGDCIRYRGDNYKIKDVETTKHGFIYNVAVIGEPSDPEEVKTAIGNAVEKDMVKIEQPSTDWSEEDSMHLTNAILAAEKEWGTESCTSKWLKSLKDRVQPQPTSEWSEEDEEMFRSLKKLLNETSCYSCTEGSDKILYWLKFIKSNHWKPSEQNLKDLEWCANLVKDKMGVGFHRLQVFIDEIKTL